jgi:hypothetical protein
MAIKAKWKINTGEAIHEPGTVVTGLSDDEEKRLIALGAAEFIEYAPVTGDSSNAIELVAFGKILQTMKKAELIAYAQKTGVEVDEKMKSDQILDAIIKDIEASGVDLDALTDEQLVQFAEANGIQAGEKSREEILDAIESHFGDAGDGQA